jgi:mRNA interferase RelE/StbE
MSYLIEFLPAALEDLQRLDRTVQTRILAKINWLEENFDQIPLQPLTSQFANSFKLRVGDYRVLYEFDEASKVITIIQVGHRRDIYKQR